MWRSVYFVSIFLRFIFATSDSYIHPDEHFQSLQILTNKVFNFSTNLPWEFTLDQPARSFGPLYLIYGPTLYLIKWLGLELTPLQIWYLVRLQNTILGWLITDACIYKLMPTKPERIKAVLFILTSYITLTYQSHLFSNSVETILLLMCVTLIDDLRYCTNHKLESKLNLFYLGIISSIGIFNRVTFPAFLVLPSWFIVKYLWIHKAQALILIFGFMIPTIAFILVDTAEFSDSIAPLGYVITPLNNLLYNSNFENLSKHGIHPRYTHILINLPQIVGPSGLLFLVFYKLRDSYWKTVPFLTCVSGLLVLSLVPHQELRFLVPLLPLLCCSFDLRKYKKLDLDKSVADKSLKETEKSLLVRKDKSSIVNVLMFGWYLFNILMAILMGIYHQGGVIPVLDHLHTTKEDDFIQVWWRTYSPPNWMLGEINTTVVTLNDENFNYNVSGLKGNYIFDTMGSDLDKVKKLLSDLEEQRSQKISLITPVSSYNIHFKETKFQNVFNYTHHLDMDHLNFSSWDTIRPGLGVYEII